MNKELKDKELENVNGGVAVSSDMVGTIRPHRRPRAETVTLHNMPDKEEYVMGVNPTD